MSSRSIIVTIAIGAAASVVATLVVRWLDQRAGNSQPFGVPAYA